MISNFYNYLENLQNTITSKIEKIDGKSSFLEDLWDHHDSGGGRTRVISNGNIFEKGGVNISSISGTLPKIMQSQLKTKNKNFSACGLSIVFHPLNPMIPTVHFNIRYFEMIDLLGNKCDQWFGGGIDLSPYYIFENDVILFHKNCKEICDKYGENLYIEYKTKCDKYFWNSHRNEARGVGGLFFDYLKDTPEKSLKEWNSFVKELGDNFLKIYLPIVNKRKEMPFTKYEKMWQEIRRGRYAEFNLIHDKGTLFGIKTKGRIESIMMSLPPTVRWQYNFFPNLGSKEEKLISILQKPKNWIK